MKPSNFQQQVNYFQPNSTDNLQILNISVYESIFQENFKKIKFNDSKENDIVKAEQYYNIVFSSQDIFNSPQNRLIETETNFIEYYDEQRKYLQKRKEKAQFLEVKKKEQIKVLSTIYDNDLSKFLAILQLLKFFAELKQKVKIDYYSHKTFCAIKSVTSEELIKMVNVLKRIYINLIEQQKEIQKSLIKQFLIIPRFLISKQKILQFINDQQIQQSFQFLVKNICLGHQNNQANKKMPRKQLIQLLQPLLQKPKGKQIFKTICSINHGNKYKLLNGIDIYNSLFQKSLEQLKLIDKKVKKIKGKKSESNKNDDQYTLKTQLIKRKLKHSASLSTSLQQQSPIPKRRSNKLEKNFHSNYKINLQQKMQGQKESQFVIRNFQTINSKIKKNIILILPPTNK